MMLTQFNLVLTKSKAVRPGDVFGRLTVVSTGQISGTYRYTAVCKCSCGSDAKAIRFDGLQSGVVVSCGCVQKERTTTHGLTKSIHYDRWRHMLDRCENSGSASFPWYGGRGIAVCERWHDLASFVSDLPDGYYKGAQIDRIDNNGNYEPGNIQWATRSENCNNRSTRRELTLDGKTQSITKWANELGTDASTIVSRLVDWNWPLEKALTTPPMTTHERMAKAHETRWSGHIKGPQPAPKLLKTVAFNGEQVTIAELSRRTGISADLLRKRIFERGWPIEKATR